MVIQELSSKEYEAINAMFNALGLANKREAREIILNSIKHLDKVESFVNRGYYFLYKYSIDQETAKYWFKDFANPGNIRNAYFPLIKNDRLLSEVQDVLSIEELVKGEMAKKL